jgi:hypothetical protein
MQKNYKNVKVYGMGIFDFSRFENLQIDDQNPKTKCCQYCLPRLNNHLQHKTVAALSVSAIGSDI